MNGWDSILSLVLPKYRDQGDTSDDDRDRDVEVISRARRLQN